MHSSFKKVIFKKGLRVKNPLKIYQIMKIPTELCPLMKSKGLGIC